MRFIDCIDMNMVKANENFDDGYYHLLKDIIDYPDATIYVIWSQRGPGKTYSALWSSYYLHMPSMYMKRTNDDTHFLCNYSTVDGDNENDPSPYAPINEDKGINVKPVELENGYGAFYNMNEDGEPEGAPVSYLASLNAIKKLKGISFRHVMLMFMDEFIPLAGERVMHKEGEWLLDLYMTILRDRVKRGLPEIKLVLMANAENISCPITRELNLIDPIYDMLAEGKDIKYLDNRRILLHHLSSEEYPTLGTIEDLGIYAATQGTAWNAKTFAGEFAANDFSMIARNKSIKRFTPEVSIKYKLEYMTVYRKNGRLHVCDKFDRNAPLYDLSNEADQMKFYTEYLLEYRFDIMDKNITFQKYSQYDLFRNYKNYYKVN